MKRVLKHRLLALALTFGLVGSLTGAALAGRCPGTLIIIGGDAVAVCHLEIEFDWGTESECYYDCQVF